MLILYITLGIICGSIGALTAFFSGAGILLAMIAYLIAGTVGTLMGVLWFVLKREPRQNNIEATETA